MPKNSFLQALFSGPKFSLAPIEKNNRGSVKIGQIVPVWATVLNPREGVELNMSHLVRFLPAKAPVMEGYKVTFDAFAIPYSALGYAERKERDIDDFFNLKENAGLIQNPYCFPMRVLPTLFKYGQIRNLDDDDRFNSAGLAHAFRLGSLGDYINFPSLKNVREHVRRWIQQNHFLDFSFPGQYFGDLVSSDSVNRHVSSVILSASLNEPTHIDSELVSFSVLLPNQYTAVLYIGVPFVTSESALLVSDDDGITNPESEVFYTFADDHVLGGLAFKSAFSLFGYVLRNYPEVASYYHFVDADTYTQYRLNMQSMANYLVDNYDSINFDYLQVLYDNYKVDAQSIYQEYFDYMMGLVLYNPELVNDNGDALYYFAGENEDDEVTFLPSLKDSEPIDLVNLAAYWKIISDWYINTNIDGDPDEFFIEHCRLLTDYDGDDDRLSSRWVDLQPFVRRWPNDIFTSAVPMAQVQNIRIPADGTIPDLRDANAMQRLQDILRNTGSRLRDVQFGIRGIRASAVRSEMSEPIATKSSWIGFQSVLQTSQTTPDSPQASYSGIGTDSSNGFDRFFKYINNAEPTPVIVMVLMSVSQRSAYMQGFDRSFFRKSIYDFAVPQLAMIGEQEVTNKEVYFDKQYETGVFGFNRRYYDWFYSGSEVHGDLRDSMDYWHGARIFDEQPALNSEFIGIEADKDHLQRIFANVSESALPIIYNISFDGYATRALPRYIQYEL